MSKESKSKSRLDKIKDSQAKGAQATLLEELFNDFYENRFKVYKMNFIRGIAFGFGSALGGTVILAILLWLATLIFGPLLGEWLDQAKNTINQAGSL